MAQRAFSLCIHILCDLRRLHFSFLFHKYDATNFDLVFQKAFQESQKNYYQVNLNDCQAQHPEVA